MRFRGLGRSLGVERSPVRIGKGLGITVRISADSKVRVLTQDSQESWRIHNP